MHESKLAQGLALGASGYMLLSGSVQLPLDRYLEDIWIHVQGKPICLFPFLSHTP